MPELRSRPSCLCICCQPQGPLEDVGRVAVLLISPLLMPSARPSTTRICYICSKNCAGALHPGSSRGSTIFLPLLPKMLLKPHPHFGEALRKAPKRPPMSLVMTTTIQAKLIPLLKSAPTRTWTI